MIECLSGRNEYITLLTDLVHEHKVSVPCHTGCGHVCSNMGHGNKPGARLNHYRAFDARLGHDEMVTLLSGDDEPVSLEDLHEFRIVNWRNLAFGHAHVLLPDGNLLFGNWYSMLPLSCWILNEARLVEDFDQRPSRVTVLDEGFNRLFDRQFRLGNGVAKARHIQLRAEPNKTLPFFENRDMRDDGWHRCFSFF